MHWEEYFLDGDETKLETNDPKDIADLVGLDISTVSRVVTVSRNALWNEID
jgi:RNA polymerase sigma-54 factor